MTTIRVFIATTQGPAEVQRISEESPDVQNVICLDGKALALPISPAYDAFVREPTGVVERAYGHSAFRIDVSAPISDGMSWQLGVLVAHGLFAAGRLAARNSASERAVWLTGEVDRDLNVLPVERLQEKMRSSTRLFSELKAAGIPLVLCLPKRSLDELNPDWWAALSLDWNLQAVQAATAIDLFETLDLDPPTTARPRPSSEPRARPHRRARSSTLAVSSIAATAAVLGSLGLTLEPAGRAVERNIAQPLSGSHGAFSIATVERRRPKDTQSCAAVNLGAAEPQVIKTVPKNTRSLTTTMASNLCELEYEITNNGPPSTIWVVGARSGQSAPLLNGKVLAHAHRLERDKSLTLSVRIPYHLRETLIQRIAVVSRQPGKVVVHDRLSASLRDIDGVMAPDNWGQILGELKSAGLAITEFNHELSP